MKIKRGIRHANDERILLGDMPPLNAAGATIKQIYLRLPRLLASAVSAIHLEGESGTGKEIVADIVESLLPPTTPFVRVNCAGIAPSLVESELFGHARGAFTGANKTKLGLIEAAAGGWLFLDELSTLSLPAQAALLRAIESKQIRRVGETNIRQVQFNLLTATNESIRDLISNGKFRSDLWQRIKEVELYLPPLRERPEEVKDIAQYFCATLPGGPYQMSDPALRLLVSHSWKAGNIRELRNTIKAMTEFRLGQLLTPLGIPSEVYSRIEELCSNEHEILNVQIPWGKGNELSFGDMCDRLFIEILLKYERDSKNNKEKPSIRRLAKRLGIARGTLRTLAERLKLENTL